jgi:RNA polymerase sigma-70 factor (ECF subfamily)
MNAAVPIVPAHDQRANVDERTARVSDSDQLIMERIRDGDQQAVVELVQRFQNELLGFFYHLCWDQLVAEELVQDVFVNVYRSRARYQPTAKVRTFLYRIAHNLWIDHVRRQKHHVSIDAEMGDRSLRLADVLKAPGGGDSDLDGRDETIRSRIQESLDGLPEGQREVFVLANNHGMKYQEIAEVLGIPEGTVKSRMHNAVRALRDDLQDLIEP